MIQKYIKNLLVVIVAVFAMSCNKDSDDTDSSNAGIRFEVENTTDQGTTTIRYKVTQGASIQLVNETIEVEDIATWTKSLDQTIDGTGVIELFALCDTYETTKVEIYYNNKLVASDSSDSGALAVAFIQ